MANLTDCVLFSSSNAEICAGIICASAPLLPAMLSSTTRKTKLFRLPSSLRNFLPRRSVGRSQSSHLTLVEASGGTRPSAKYVQTPSEEEFSMKLARGFEVRSQLVHGERTFRAEVERNDISTISGRV